jgi:hypothetical protein
MVSNENFIKLICCKSKAFFLEMQILEKIVFLQKLRNYGIYSNSIGRIAESDHRG